MKYFLLLLVCIFFTVQFVFYKLYQSRTDGKLPAATWALLTTALTVLVCVSPFCIGNFSITIESFIIAIIYSAGFLISTLATLPAMKLGNLTTVTTFTLTGSIIIPFIYGIFLKEEIGIARIIGVSLILLSLVPDIVASVINRNKTGEAKSGKSSKGGLVYIILCVLIFLSNGAAAVSMKAVTVISPDVTFASFMTVTAVIRVLASVPILLIAANKSKKAACDCAEIATSPAKTNTSFFKSPLLLTAIFCVLYALCNMLGTIFNLQCTTLMDSSFQFPVSNGAIIVGTAFMSLLFFKEKFKFNNIAGVCLALAGIIVYAL